MHSVPKIFTNLLLPILEYFLNQNMDSHGKDYSIAVKISMKFYQRWLPGDQYWHQAKEFCTHANLSRISGEVLENLW